MCKKIPISRDYLWPKKQEMAILNDCTYKNLARILTRAIGDVEFFNGTVCYEADGYAVNLRTTLLVQRYKAGGGGSPGRIKDIRPVWCECEVTRGGRVVANEFSWSEFRRFLTPPEPSRVGRTEPSLINHV